MICMSNLMISSGDESIYSPDMKYHRHRMFSCQVMFHVNELAVITESERDALFLKDA